MEFFKNSRIDVYSKVWEFMQSRPYVMVNTTQEGVEFVQGAEGRYAFLLEAGLNDYYRYSSFLAAVIGRTSPGIAFVLFLSFQRHICLLLFMNIPLGSLGVLKISEFLRISLVGSFWISWSF